MSTAMERGAVLDEAQHAAQDEPSPSPLESVGEHSASGKDQSPAQSEVERAYKPLAFDITGRKRIPVGYIALDRALDQLGRDQYPKEWGRASCWTEMPFRWKSEKKGYYKSVIKGRGTKRKVVIKPVEASGSRLENRRCGKIYREVYIMMSLAFEDGSIKASSLMPSGGDLVPMSAKGIWITQWSPIFYAGVVPVDDKICRVFVEERSFNAWMQSRSKHIALDGDARLLTSVKEIFETWAKQNQCLILKNDLLEILEKAFDNRGLKRLKPLIEKHIWRMFSEKRKSGPPKTDHATAFKSGKAALQSAIDAELQRCMTSPDRDYPPLINGPSTACSHQKADR